MVLLILYYFSVKLIPSFFFFNDTATTEIYTLSLHDALPISTGHSHFRYDPRMDDKALFEAGRSEEHTSELQSQSNLVCRLLLEKKKKTIAKLLHIVNGHIFDCEADSLPYEHNTL